MGFLDKDISQLSLSELQRLIRQEVSSQLPPIPAGVAALDDSALPVTVAQIGTQGQVPTFHAPGSNFVFTNPGAMGDGSAPSTSPSLAASTAVVGGIGLLNAVWTAITNSDPVGYDVHISSVAGFTPDATTLYGTTMATSMVIKSQANGSSLIYNTNYYVRIVAFDNDGAAAAGVISAATKISADIGTITAGTLIGATVETAATGQRVVLDAAGAHLYASDGSLIVDLPTDVLATAAFNGSLTAQSLISLAATLNGTTQLSTGSTLALLSGVGQPLNTPAVALAAGGTLSASTRYYVAYSWYDGTHETQISPVTSISTDTTNKTIVITLPPAPAGATQARIYFNTASFGTGSGHLQQTVNPVSSSLPTTASQASYASGGAASSSSNTFPAGTGAVIQPNGVLDSAGNSYTWIASGGGRIRFLGPTVNLQFYYYTEFLNTSTALPDSLFETTSAGGGAGNGWSTGTSTNVNPGVVRVITGTGTTATDAIRTAAAVIATGVARLRATFYAAMTTTGGVGAIPNGTNSYNVLLGLTDQTAPPASMGGTGNSIAFGTASTSSPLLGLWVTKAGVGAFHQAVDAAASNVSWAINTYVLLDFEVNAAGTSIDWWVNGVKQTAVTNNIPTALMGLEVGITKTAGAAVRELSIDTMALYGDYAS